MMCRLAGEAAMFGHIQVAWEWCSVSYVHTLSPCLQPSQASCVSDDVLHV